MLGWFISVRSSFKMQRMLVQAKWNFFMTDTAMEEKNYTAKNLLSFRSAYYHLSTFKFVNKRIYQLVLICNSFYEPWPYF